MSRKYNFFITDWRDFGDAQKKAIEGALSDGECLMLAIRDFECSPINAITPLEVMSKIMDAFDHEIKKEALKVMVIPDISSISYLENNLPILIKDLEA